MRYIMPSMARSSGRHPASPSCTARDAIQGIA